MTETCQHLIRFFRTLTIWLKRSISIACHPNLQIALSTLKSASFIQIQRLGYHLQPNGFYTPLNDCNFLSQNQDLWRSRPPNRGIDWNIDGQLKTSKTVGKYIDELQDVPTRHIPGKLEYCWDNYFWNNADALVQYALIRHYKPRRFVEIGCGWSSLLLQRAIEKNGSPCKVVQIEPYPNANIFSVLPKTWVHYNVILQRVPTHVFEELQAGDICFYDGSHCSKEGSDVNWFFFEILPSLAPGVIIHLHDIFLPDSYPEQWIFERGQTWNEQYILQAFLMHNKSYEIIIANRYLWRMEQKILEDAYKGVQPAYGCSFWMRKLG